MKECQYDVLGMHCAGCSSRVEKKVRALECVESANVNLLAHCLTVIFKDAQDDEIIVQAVTATGFKCTPLTPPEEETPEEPLPEEPKKPEQDEAAEVLSRLLPSAAIWLAIVLLMLWKMFLSGNAAIAGSAQLALTLVIFYINRHIFIGGFKQLFHEADMNSLVALGSTASFLLSIYTLAEILLNHSNGHFYFESASMILVIVSFGKYLEAKAKRKAGAALEKLRNMVPQNVTKIIGSQEKEVSISSIKCGDILLVKPGSQIPFDGEITDGTSSVDEASLTGESLPRDVTTGASVFAGTLNLTGAFRMKATKVGQDTLLAGIIRLVSQSAVSKTGAIRLADALAAKFVPIVGIISIITAIVHLALGSSVVDSLSYAISVLVVSCPCALGLATPVAVTIAMARAAQQGLIFKSGEAMEKLRDISKIFFDKTGTLTTGKPQVTDVIPEANVSEQELLQIAASLESASEHPIAKAVLSKAKSEGIAYQTVTEFSSKSGRGIIAKYQGKECLAGNAAFLHENGIELPDETKAIAEKLAGEGKTLLFVSKDRILLGTVAVRDTIAQGSQEAISGLKDLGIDSVMLSGDTHPTAQAIAASLGIPEFKASLLPADKAAAIKDAQTAGAKVAMVGDGINDAPALSQADIGISVGTGTDIAIDCADIIVLGSRMDVLPRAVRLSRATLTNIRQNLFWAFFYNLLAIPVAAGALASFGVKLNPILAAVAMTCSSICVVSNALRLRKY